MDMGGRGKGERREAIGQAARLAGIGQTLTGMPSSRSNLRASERDGVLPPAKS